MTHLNGSGRPLQRKSFWISMTRVCFSSTGKMVRTGSIHLIYLQGTSYWMIGTSKLLWHGRVLLSTSMQKSPIAPARLLKSVAQEGWVQHRPSWTLTLWITRSEEERRVGQEGRCRDGQVQA